MRRETRGRLLSGQKRERRDDVLGNNSGSSITVKEAGLNSNASNMGLYLWERSVLNPTVPVPNGAQFTVTYNVIMDFSAIDY
jgi:hypothetical protein